MAQNQAKIKMVTGKLKRRKVFDSWSYGKMLPLGSRQPSGGRPGDGYAPYPASTVLDQQDIHTLFAHALVGLLLVLIFIDILIFDNYYRI